MGFHVIKVTGEQAEQLVPFDDVKTRLATVLKAQVQQKVAAEYILELREKATIKLDGVLATVSEAAKAKQAAEPVAAEAPAP